MITIMAKTAGMCQGPECHASGFRNQSRALISALLIAMGLSGGSASETSPITLKEQAVTVVFTARIVPRDGAALDSPELKLRLPIDLPHQTIGKPDIEGKPKLLRDLWRSPVLIYRRAHLMPGEILTGRWSASTRLREFQWTLPATNLSPKSVLSAKQRRLYLRDAQAFGLTNPVVRNAAEEACAGKNDEVAQLDGIFAHVMEKMNYERDGKWQPAPQALASGKGSCSEFTYAFVAMCRARGIPARYVGGIVGRAEVPFHIDTVFHRYPQVFLKGVGWVDFDPTRTKRAKNPRMYFGRTSPNMVLLCVGEGGQGSLTGWDYLESHSWAGGNSKAVRIRTAWWFPEPTTAAKQAVAAFRNSMAKSDCDFEVLIANALAINHPFVLPWLDDLLYERRARVSAAKAFLKIGGDGALQAVINSLRRLPDPEGDREIGALLNSFAGQEFGSDRAKWQEWLKSGRAPISSASSAKAPPPA